MFNEIVTNLYIIFYSAKYINVKSHYIRSLQAYSTLNKTIKETGLKIEANDLSY